MGFVCDVMRPHNSDLKRYFYVTLGLNISQYSPILGEISVESWGVSMARCEIPCL